MVTISLNGAEFFAYHGFYPEEQKLGSRFVVDVQVDFDPAGKPGDDKITNTVDYEKLYHIVAEQMGETKKLIETVAQAIANNINQQFPLAESVRVCVKKLNPPFNGKADYASVLITT